MPINDILPASSSNNAAITISPRAPPDNISSFGDDAPFRVVSDVLSPAGGQSIVSMPEAEAEELDEQLNSGPALQEHQIITPDEQPGPESPEAASSPAAPIADMDIPDGDLADDELPQPDELPAAVASAKKRGRPSATPGKTPAKAKTPRTAATTNGHATASRATSGRKRKAEDEPAEEATPVKRPRGRPGRPAAATASARLAAKSAKKAKPGRPKGSGAVRSSRYGAQSGRCLCVPRLTNPSQAAPKATTNPKRGGPKGASKQDSSSNSEAVPKGEYEVEEILESVIDADTFEHMYRVKWKGYGLNEATWEPKTNLGHAAALIKAFDSNQAKETRKPRGAASTNGAAPKATKAAKSKSKEVKKPGRPPGRPKKAAGRPAAVAKPVKKAAGRPAGRTSGRGVGRPKKASSS
ncbi:hypothetical protein CONLIGDRAFT_512881 [Coniochaeta ligniaria NRRL 30616]|uniref:Chromo domain-containing protein n=1 Tax=Coniochaeta ligniaria NRRL 30616 TaxID=1408157 RepID=A0A1J7IEV2_9PEZI|nr:hypothetical protein CONLIGDRAFT_512881 [Coniochaeta ligniaria NRRL 30616]